MTCFVDFSSLLLSFFFAILFLYWWIKKRTWNLPPGPTGLPIVGYLPFLGDEPYETMRQLSKKYGKIFSIRMGLNYTIVINDFESLKEAFNNSAILDRPNSMFDFVPDGLGFASKNGSEWVEQRRHTMRLLKDVGIGKIPWEITVQDEVEEFLSFLEECGGHPVDISNSLSISVSNNITSIVLGKRLGVNDPRRQIVEKGVTSIIKTMSQTGIIIFFGKWVKVLAKLGLTGYAKEYKNMKEYNEVIRKEMESRKHLDQTELKEEDFIDGYLMEIRRSKEKNIKNYFTERNLVGIAQNLVVAGGDTTKSAVAWLFLLAAGFPEVQKKIQEEIDRVLGRDGKLKWSQRDNLPYTYATIQELLRWKTLAPLGAVHRASEDTKVGEYDIPKGTNVLSNIYAIHMDPKYWKNPHDFLPERFLDGKGKLTSNRMDGYIPFSMGRRNCPGEAIAMMEIFQYFVAVLQKFVILPLDGASVNFRGINEASLQPVSQELRYILRE